MASRRLNWQASNRLPLVHWRWPADQAVTSRMVLAAVVLCAFGVAFLNARPQPQWLLWGGAALTFLATDGIIRLSPRWADASPFSALAWGVLPALAFLGSGYVLDSWAEGYFRLLAGFGVGFIATATIVAEYYTVSVGEQRYGASRVFLTVAAYTIGFALLYAVNDAGLPYMWRAALAGAISFVLAAEILRESHIVGVSTPLAALAVAVSIAELQLALYFFPLEELARSALLAIGFYLASGSLHHLLENDLDLYVAFEYALVAVAGVLGVLLIQQGL